MHRYLMYNANLVPKQIIRMSSSVSLSQPHSSKANKDLQIPKFIYGTAWKKDKTATLVYEALKAGFRAIDTAAQPRHYDEKRVGRGILKALDEGIVRREELYIQTKFTPVSGQDTANMPYNPNDPLEMQIEDSIASSLSNFTFSSVEPPYLDALILHSPLPEITQTCFAWSVLERYVPAQIRSLGVSNTSLETLQTLHLKMKIRPTVVQNRFCRENQWETKLRKFCRDKGIIFQSFWTLTGNLELGRAQVALDFANKLQREGIEEPKALAMYTLVLGLGGISALNGTTNKDRMFADLTGLEEINRLISGKLNDQWSVWMREFKKVIGES